jgi:DNA-binding NarL/FixJ family response regulator
MSASTSHKIRLLVVDDHPVVRKGLVSILVDEPDLEVVGEAQNATEAVSLHRQLRPDVTLMDVVMPGPSGADAIAEIRSDSPQARVLVLSTFAGDEDIHRALAAGARGYLLKDSPTRDILDAIRIIAAGGRRVPEPIAERLAERVPHTELSPRELDVLRLVAQGTSNKLIADRLGITEGTVKSHVSNILIKLGADDRTGAVTTALARGILRI